MMYEPWFDIAIVLCLISLFIEYYDLKTYRDERHWKVCFLLNLLVIGSVMVGVIQLLVSIL